MSLCLCRTFFETSGKTMSQTFWAEFPALLLILGVFSGFLQWRRWLLCSGGFLRLCLPLSRLMWQVWHVETPCGVGQWKKLCWVGSSRETSLEVKQHANLPILLGWTAPLCPRAGGLCTGRGELTEAEVARGNQTILIYQTVKILSLQLRRRAINCVLITAAATSSECCNLRREWEETLN